MAKRRRIMGEGGLKAAKSGRFLTDETGAATSAHLVLTAFVVAMVLVAAPMIRDAVTDLAMEMSENLDGIGVGPTKSPTDGNWGAGDKGNKPGKSNLVS